MPPLITLLTDFGTQDAYVGILKGVIAQICPEAQMIDLTHEIPPQDLSAARFNLLNACPYFPLGTLHLAIVDPGVGTARRGIAIQTNTAFLVGPDNGIFSGVIQRNPPIMAVALTEPAYWRTPSISATFHGRDVFAPVAAHLAKGVPIQALGEAVDPRSLVRLDIPDAIREGDRVQGRVQYCDRFGNLITNLVPEDLPSAPWQVQIGDHTLSSARTYGEAPLGQPLALIGSHGWLEIAINGGNAQKTLQARVGTPFKVKPLP